MHDGFDMKVSLVALQLLDQHDPIGAEAEVAAAGPAATRRVVAAELDR